MRQLTGSSLVQVMIGLLLASKQLPEQMLAYWLLAPSFKNQLQGNLKRDT